MHLAKLQFCVCDALQHIESQRCIVSQLDKPSSSVYCILCVEGLIWWPVVLIIDASNSHYTAWWVAAVLYALEID